MKEIALDNLQRGYNELHRKLQESNRKMKGAEEREQKLSANLKPKLQQAVEHQKSLYEQFNQIKEDT